MRYKKQIVTMTVIITVCTLGIFACKGSKEPSKKVARRAAARTSVSKPAVEETVALQTKKESPKYIYKSSGRRDPFVPLVGRVEVRPVDTGKVSPVSKTQVNIAMLTVKGLIWDKEKPFVLFKAPDGTSYIVKEQRLVDDRGRIIEGIAAIIKKDKVVLIGKDNNIKEFKFSKLREGSE